MTNSATNSINNQIIYTIKDNTDTEFTFIINKINRLEKIGSTLRVALNNEIIRLSFNDDDECIGVRDRFIELMGDINLTPQCCVGALGNDNVDLKMKDRNKTGF